MKYKKHGLYGFHSDGKGDTNEEIEEALWSAFNGGGGRWDLNTETAIKKRVAFETEIQGYTYITIVKQKEVSYDNVELP